MPAKNEATAGSLPTAAGSVPKFLPRYSEVFIDDGYVDMKQVMAIYEKCGFDGTIIPDHTPRLDATDFWETGMAFALGYMHGIMYLR